MHLYVARNGLGWLAGKLGFEAGSSGANAVFILGIIIGCIAVPYLIGSLNPAIIFSKLLYHDDIRTHGSGNAGSTNMLRTYGKKAAVLVFACDLLKAAVAVLIGGLLLVDEGAAIAGLFVVVGHMFPIYYKFHGGKGVASTAMVVLLISPITLAILVIVFLIIVIGTKYISLGSVIGSLLYPVILKSVDSIINKLVVDNAAAEGQALLPAGGMAEICAVITAILIVFMHRQNIKRLLAGEESKVSFKKKPEAQTAPAPEAKEQAKDAPEGNYVKCEGCKRLIPVGRKVCAYCKTENKFYDPEKDIFEKEKRGKK